MKYPDFFIVGAPRCGTTAMHGFLRAHPEIFMPFWKEIHHFGSDLSALKTQITPQQYSEFFRGAEKKRCVGETCIYAMFSTRAAEEIHRELPAAKIVIMLRNPVDMVYSLHNEFIYRGLEDVKDLRKALILEGERKFGRLLPSTDVPARLFQYREMASFGEQVSRYYGVFPRNQIHTILFDDFRDDLAGVYRRLLEFLGVDPGFRPQFEVINPNKRVRSLLLRRLVNHPNPWLLSLAQAMIPSPDLRKRLYDGFEHWNVSYVPRPQMNERLRCQLTAELVPDVERLSRLLQRDLGPWMGRPARS